MGHFIRRGISRSTQEAIRSLSLHANHVARSRTDIILVRSEVLLAVTMKLPSGREYGRCLPTFRRNVLLQSSGQKRQYSELFYPQNGGSTFLGMSVALFRFVATCCLHLHSISVHENGGSMYLRNVGSTSLCHMTQRSNRIDIGNEHAALTLYRHTPQIRDETSLQLEYEAKEEGLQRDKRPICFPAT